jgi:hypothetical protein
MEPKFNLGPIFATVICCVWPIVVHLLITKSGTWIRVVRGRSSKRIVMGGK